MDTDNDPIPYEMTPKALEVIEAIRPVSPADPGHTTPLQAIENTLAALETEFIWLRGVPTRDGALVVMARASTIANMANQMAPEHRHMIGTANDIYHEALKIRRAER